MLKYTIALSSLYKYLPSDVAELTLSFLEDQKKYNNEERKIMGKIKDDNEEWEKISEIYINTKILQMTLDESYDDIEKNRIKNNYNMLNNDNNLGECYYDDDEEYDDDWGSPTKNDKLNWD